MKFLRPNSQTHWQYLAILAGLGLLAASAIWWVAGNTSALQSASEASQQPLSANDQTNWKIYQNEEYGFEVKYPEDFSVFTSEQKRLRTDLPNVTNSIFAIGKSNSFEGTVLGTGRHFWIYAVSGASDAQACYTKSDDGALLTQHRAVKSEDFYYSDVFGGVGLGTHWAIQEYKVLKHNTCLGIGVAHTESSDWNNPDDFALAKKDEEKAFEVFDQILSTFRFVE
ncbi:MAG: hypothetical protein A2748_01220 [Candidatus Wildermuthbacteria bacterium RIFCSPHIGHO2_01_FULL_45_20]|uniref:Uncharacterized protein n=1 Tax=Candidatus Wildermuthbacteria bacterium RIFCSPHIGHO2_02_FULL_45_25 TaxID=1802450 RepID=A0A1G2R4U7_9BACT|nr:MAG: hypothetical protein A2748_01220 [Candidatus Wildermuthbacteria bacterium RIFCSPHIGHO2_01_FULL_45_20]OHA67856.1 MAG: hypothetical protein A3C04_02885 [Candidatus Wildermuthbacteria bacterium RIFCSPHIGHO2_02_FULL_45_25]